MARKSKEVLRHFHTYTRKHSGSWRMHACRSLQQAHFKRWKPRQAIMHHSFLTDCTYIHWGSLGKFQKYALELQKCHTTYKMTGTNVPHLMPFEDWKEVLSFGGGIFLPSPSLSDTFIFTQHDYCK